VLAELATIEAMRSANNGGPWTTWLVLGGRGAGKTRLGAEWVRALAHGRPPSKWRLAERAFDTLQFGLRLGERPRQLVTTTPRPIALL